MHLKLKDFLTIIESARITIQRSNISKKLNIDINSYTRGLIKSAYIFNQIDKNMKSAAYKHFNLVSSEPLLNKSKQEQYFLDQEIDFELQERKLNDFLDQQEEIKYVNQVMGMDGNNKLNEELEEKRRDEKRGLYPNKVDIAN